MVAPSADAACQMPETAVTDGVRQCRNMGIQLNRTIRILVGPSRVAGWGAFAPHSITKGEFVVEYVGELISHEEADRRGQVYDRLASSYLFDLNDKQVVDAGRMGNRSRYANHDDHPNVITRIMTARGDHRIGLYASVTIERGEELFFDYRYDHEERRMYGFCAEKQRAERKRKLLPDMKNSLHARRKRHGRDLCVEI